MRHYTQCREIAEDTGGKRFSKMIFVNYNIDRFVQICSCSIPINNSEEHRCPTWPGEYNIDRETLGKIQHFAIDFARCIKYEFSGRLWECIGLLKQLTQLDVVTIMIGSKRIWTSEIEAKFHPMTDEVTQRELMERYIGGVRRCQFWQQWVWPYQMEYIMNKAVVLRVEGGKLREYQGAFRFDIARRGFLQ